MSTIEELQTAAEAAQHALAEALADGNALPITRARKAAQEAAQAVSDAIAVADILKQREQAVEAKRRAADQAERRAKVAALATERLEAARVVEKIAVDLGEAYETLLKTSQSIADISPDELEDTTGLIRGQQIMYAYFEQLQRSRCLLGKPIVGLTEWELMQRPALSDKIRAANDYLSTMEVRHG